jgi:hypothetical protein
VKQLSERMKHKMETQDANYKCAILVNIRVTCLLYKLVDAIDFLQCNELFVIGKSTIHLVFQNFISKNLGENKHGGMRPNFDDQATNQGSEPTL